MPTSKELDKFYTKPETAKRLISKTCEVLSLDEPTQFFLEPSAGSGAFSSNFFNGEAYDLLPEGNGIKQADFLTLEPSWTLTDTVAVGNPPFGKKGKLACEFLNKCGTTCSAVAFILPSTFKRWSVQSKIDKNLKLVYEEQLPLDSFEFEGSPFSLNCVFQIWVRKDMPQWDNLPNLRIPSKPPISHPDFEIWQHNATEQSRKYLDYPWDAAMWRQGYKDYSKRFHNPEDYDEVKSIIYDTNLQLFLIHYNCERAREIVEKEMDLDSLAKENLATPGFGKADFVRYYTELLGHRTDSQS